MFGYVRPFRDGLLQAETDRFQSVYCGLCRALSLRYGFLARFFLSYDLTFFASVLPSESETLTSCRCPANPLKKKPAFMSPVIDFTADLTVLLTRGKFLDSVRDEGALRRAGAGAVSLMLSRTFQTAALRRPALSDYISSSLHSLWEMEMRGEPSLDRPADTFAGILRFAAAEGPGSSIRRISEPLFYHLGRFIYLLDAVDDFDGDIKNRRYNPIAARYALSAPSIPEEVKNALSHTLSLSLRDASLAAEFLEPGPRIGIASNVLNFGLPAVSRAVFSGSWKKRRPKK